MFRQSFILTIPLFLAACLPEREAPTGAEDFAAYCSTCHGAAGRGDGPAAAGLPQKPANLAQLSARNGGKFPATRVMGKIWGYTGGTGDHAVMPEFAALLDSDLVPYDGGDGIATPTPVRLVQISEYLETLQN